MNRAEALGVSLVYLRWKSDRMNAVLSPKWIEAPSSRGRVFVRESVRLERTGLERRTRAMALAGVVGSGRWASS